MTTQLTLKAIKILEAKYEQRFKDIVKWNIMARQIDVPDFYAIRQNLSLPVIEPSLQNINQNHLSGYNSGGGPDSHKQTWKLGVVNESYISDTDVLPESGKCMKP